MRRLLILGVLFLCGCAGISGPFTPRQPERVDDPRFNTAEQYRRERERLALPQETKTVAPNIPVANTPYAIYR